MGYTYDHVRKESGTLFGGWSHTSVQRVLGSPSTFSLRYYGDDLMVWKKDRIIIGPKWHSQSIKRRLNWAMPGPSAIDVKAGEWILTTRNGRYVMPASTARKPTSITLWPDGRVSGKVQPYEKWWAKRKVEWLAHRREQARLRYWQSAARLVRNREADLRTNGSSPIVLSAHPRLTVKAVLAEKNTTIRMTKARVYGIDKFLSDAGAKVIDTEAGYELLEFQLGNEVQNVWDATLQKRVRRRVPEIIRAVRMTCSSTHEGYIETVSPALNKATVRDALDWRYGMGEYANGDPTRAGSYLDRVGQQT